MPASTRHDEHAAGAQRDVNRAARAEDREIDLPFEDLDQLVAVPVTLPRRAAAEATHEDAAVVERG